MKTVFTLSYFREYEYRNDTFLAIGIYASEEEALAKIEELKDKPGYCDFPEGFQVAEETLGHTCWSEGFITTYGLPPKDADAEAIDVPAWIKNYDEKGRKIGSNVVPFSEKCSSPRT